MRGVLAIAVLLMSRRAQGQSSRTGSYDTTSRAILVRIAVPRNFALERTLHVLDSAGYDADDGDGTVDSVTTRPRYVEAAGMVTICVRVLRADSVTVIALSGQVRRLRRVLMFSTLSEVEPVIRTGHQAYQRRAWDALTDLAAAIVPLNTTGRP